MAALKPLGLVCALAMVWPVHANDCDNRRRLPGVMPQCDEAGNVTAPPTENQIPRPTLKDYSAGVPLPDRWRIVNGIGQKFTWYDPYNRNPLKADVPVHDDWFFSVTAISDTVYEKRRVPTPVGGQSTNDPGDLDLLGSTDQTMLISNLAVELVYYQGDTVFKPPDWEFRLTPVFNYNDTKLDEVVGIDVDPLEGKTRYKDFVGFQAAFVDKHLRNVSDRYDFDSLRVGIQPFNIDFRGFLFQDSQLGVRLFGTRDNNIFQYNLAWFRRLEKDINSGLNDIGDAVRDDDVFIANLIWQDPLFMGHNLLFSVLHNSNREDEFFFDANGFIQRPFSFGNEKPREYEVTYFGLSSDGHIGRLNITSSFYLAWGEQESSVFRDKETDIRAGFAAIELSRDFDWARFRFSALYSTGDDDPFDDQDEGFDSVFENPQFAGADTSYWIRQAVPLIGGGRVALSARNGVLNSLRASKEHGQSNFTNPGTVLYGVGGDFDLTPETRLSFNVNYIGFVTTEVLEVARQQASIDEAVGIDASLSLIHRPFMSQNIVLRASFARLKPGKGYRQLFGSEPQTSLLLNATVVY